MSVPASAGGRPPASPGPSTQAGPATPRRVASSAQRGGRSGLGATRSVANPTKVLFVYLLDLNLNTGLLFCFAVSQPRSTFLWKSHIFLESSKSKLSYA